jgi:hypothetical protein
LIRRKQKQAFQQLSEHSISLTPLIVAEQQTMAKTKDTLESTTYGPSTANEEAFKPGSPSLYRLSGTWLQTRSNAEIHAYNHYAQCNASVLETGPMEYYVSMRSASPCARHEHHNAVICHTTLECHLPLFPTSDTVRTYTF